MAPKLYMLPASPAVRSVFLCAKAIGLELDLVVVNLFKGEHLTPEYLKVSINIRNNNNFFGVLEIRIHLGICWEKGVHEIMHFKNK